MKNAGKILIAMALLSCLAGCASSHYIADQPAEPAYNRPDAPFAGAVWVSGDWAWQNGKYVYTNGYWSRPRNNRVWVAGQWERGAQGYYWRKGHWR